MRLVYEGTQQEVAVGDVRETSKGETVRVTSIEKPRHGGSTGRVYLKNEKDNWEHGYYPSVIGAVWIEREDQD